MTSSGTVRAYDADAGWGVIDGPDVPGGCWVHFSAIAMDGYRQLTPGQRVSFVAEAAQQEGYAFRAVRVWTGGTEPPEDQSGPSSSGAYQSSLTLTSDQPARADRSEPD